MSLLSSSTILRESLTIEQADLLAESNWIMLKSPLTGTLLEHLSFKATLTVAKVWILDYTLNGSLQNDPLIYD